ncbi:MAG: hypothetical protein JW839_18255 [Candidatus Lokiarchaeota archaeon]|nr:hypothetical protein [Candidatus Lokiarchaeota archaeon]
MDRGGLDTRGIIDTLQYPVVDPETKQVLLYKPRWLRALLAASGLSDADIVASLARNGPFVSFQSNWCGDTSVKG